MKPWIRIYRNGHDWRSVEYRKALEVRFGWLGLQGGLMLWRVGFSLWNGQHDPIVQLNWLPATVTK